MEQLIEIDGSYGEGGGQILRTSLALASLLRRPLRIYNIRAGRKKPGLQAQHLTCVSALAEISLATLKGAELFSEELFFSPQQIKGGRFLFDVSKVRASAGSVSLIFQALLPSLIWAGESSSLMLSGGTHVPWSPPYHYLEQVFLPMISKMGVEVELNLDRWGWYPKGGGIVEAHIKPGRELGGIKLEDRGELKGIRGISALSNLKLSIAERQRSQALKCLGKAGYEADISITNASAIGQGTVVFLLAEFEGSVAAFTSLGERGKRAEQVAEEACRELLDFLKSDAAIDKYLADQLIPYVALVDEDSSFTTSCISQHLLTNIWVVEKFLPGQFEVRGREGEKGEVSVKHF